MMITVSLANPHPTGLIRKPLRVASASLHAAAWLAVVLLFLAAQPRRSEAADADASTSTAPAATTFVDYLATWKIDRGSRSVLEEPSDWSPAKQETALKVLARLTRVPANLAVQWATDAIDLGSLVASQRVQDRLVKIAGRATFVATVPLTEDEAEVAGRRQLEVVRIVTPDGTAVDVLADHVPKAWPRAATIDEPTAAVGLPLSEGHGPAVGPAGQAPAVLLAAASVGWFPPTPLGTLGMDYGLFDSVVDGQKLVAGDTEAFYAMLAAIGQAKAAGIASVAGPPGDIVPLINPGADWYAKHRGDPFTVEGVARRATRIEVDDPLRRRQLGTDHYWELFVFVPTPLIQIHGKLQEDYPVVCCVRTLPEGMPTGQQIGERVRVSGFAMKRYGYPLPDVKISSSQGTEEQKGQRQETALVVGREASWLPAPSPTREVNTLGWIFLGIASVIGLALALAAWSFARDSRRGDRRAREELPDRIELP
jgi:hypothetical protein